MPVNDIPKLVNVSILEGKLAGIEEAWRVLEKHHIIGDKHKELLEGLYNQYLKEKYELDDTCEIYSEHGVPNYTFKKSKYMYVEDK